MRDPQQVSIAKLIEDRVWSLIPPSSVIHVYNRLYFGDELTRRRIDVKVQLMSPFLLNC